jgi:acetyl-CoA carboxylase carboxyl transferase subunit alpha
MSVDLDFESPVREIEKMVEKLKHLAEKEKGDYTEQIAKLEKRIVDQRKEVYSNLTPWQKVQVARHPKRPILEDYIRMIFTDFTELHGDRRFSDDRALIGGFARLGKHDVMLIGHNKGKTIEDNLDRNFGSARPEGYRKALRLMKLAEKFNVPVVTMIDTSGAFPGKEAEERGQAEAIARNLVEMAGLTVPIVCVVTGEGGSGGALGIGVGDAILMLSFSIYSVISPEGCASILWRDGKYAPEAAEALKITSDSLLELGVIDEIISEPDCAAHNAPERTAAEVKKVVEKQLDRLKRYSSSRLIHKRFEKFSKMGMFNK